MNHFEKNWKPVNLSNYYQQKQSRGFGGTTTNDWYSKLMISNVGRKEKLRRYDQMDVTVDINRALDIVAEDISSEDASDNKIFNIDFSMFGNSSKAQVKTLEQTLNLWEKRTGFDYKFFDIIRDVCKYGMVLLRKNNNGSFEKLVADRVEGYKIDKDDSNKVTHYIYNHSSSYKNKNDDTIQGADTTEKKELIDIKDLVILKIGDTPMGKSLLEDVYRVWKQLQLLEDSVVIYRIVRAPERRVFYIDMGGMAGTKGEAYLDRVKNKIKQKQVVRDGSVETEYNPASTQEDYFIGVSGEGKGSRVETLPGGENLGRIEDLQYFNRKLALGLRIPPSYMDSSGESDKDTYSDGRVGTAYIAELRYVGFVKRLQKGLAKPLFKHFKEFSKKEGVEIPEELEFYIEPPQSFAEYKESELNSVLLNLYASAEGIESMSKRFALEKFMRMDTAEISLNEELKLKEMGYDKKSISSMAEEIKMNLVYGDGSAASKLEDEPIEQDGYDELDVGGDEAGKAVTINIQK
jgi:hypothetical protein